MTTTAAPPWPGADQMTALLTQQLTERSAQDPLAAMLLAQLQSNAEGDSAPDGLDRLEQCLDAALRANERLREAVSAGDEMCRWVARLIGACPACWGLRIQCPDCRGLGRPGSLAADVDALVAWIGPTLQRHGLTLVATTPDHLPVAQPRPDTTRAREQEER